MKQKAEVVWIAGGRLKGAKNYVPMGQWFKCKAASQEEIDTRHTKGAGEVIKTMTDEGYEYKPMKFIYAGDKAS